jgi:hypothetical protein
MERFRDKIEALKQFRANAYILTIDAAVPLEVEIVKMNTDRLYNLGEYPSGQPVRPDYTPLTIKIKKSKGQPTDRVTLKDTGDFHDSFYVKFERDQFIILASDVKAGKLVAKYGFEIFGLSEEDLIDLLPKIYANLLSKFKEAAYA